MSGEAPARVRRDPRASRATGSRSASSSPATSVVRRREQGGLSAFVVLPGPVQPVDATPRLLGLARSFAGDDGVVWLFGERISDAGGDGADRVVSDPAFGIGAYDLGRVLAIVGGCEQSIAPRAIIFPDTLLGREAAARLAALHGEPLVRDIVRARDGHAIAYSEGAEFLHRDVRILVVEPDWIAPPQNIEICEGRTMDPAFVVVPVLPEQIGSITREPSQTMPLEEAPLVLCVGQGVTDFEAAIRAAARMGAALGGTRPVCDAGRLDRSRQIGASGRRATPDLYMAFGVSGAPQHLEGVTGAARVVAVNTDATAPMMARADVAIVADAGAVILELDRLVQRPS